MQLAMIRINAFRTFWNFMDQIFVEIFNVTRKISTNSWVLSLIQEFVFKAHWNTIQLLRPSSFLNYAFYPAVCVYKLIKPKIFQTKIWGVNGRVSKISKTNFNWICTTRALLCGFAHCLWFYQTPLSIFRNLLSINDLYNEANSKCLQPLRFGAIHNLKMRVQTTLLQL